MHFYVFTYREGTKIPFYERTCGDLITALTRAEETGREGFVTVDCVPKKFWY